MESFLSSWALWNVFIGLGCAACLLWFEMLGFRTVKIFLSKLSKISFSNCQTFPFQTVKNFFFKLSKFSFSNCQTFPFQTVKNFFFKLSNFSFLYCQNFFFKLSNFSFSNCQKFLFQTVKLFLFKLSNFSFSNCQTFPFQTVKIFLSQTVKISTVLASRNHPKHSKTSSTKSPLTKHTQSINQIKIALNIHQTVK